MTIPEAELILADIEAEISILNYSTVERLCDELDALLPVDNPELMYCRQRSHILRLLSQSYQLYHVHYKPSEAIAVAYSALALATQAQSTIDEAHVLKAISSISMNSSDFAGAAESGFRALALYQKAGDEKGAANVMSNLGNMYSMQNDYTRALEYCFQSLAAHDKLGNRISTAKTLSFIGGIYASLQEYTQALEYLQEGLGIYLEGGYDTGIMESFSNIGALYADIGDYPRSIEFTNKAIAFCENSSIENHGLLANNLCNLGVVYQHLGEFSLALEYYHRTLAMYAETESNDTVAVIIGNIGELYANDLYEGYDECKAEEFLLRSVARYDQSKERNLLEPIRALAALYTKQRRFEEANKYLILAHSYEKEILHAEAKKQANQYAAERQNAERDKALAIERAKALATDDILANILPPNITKRLLAGEKKIADTHESVSVLFVDIVGFTQISAQLPASELIDLLDIIFTRFDSICKRHGLEKIKTIGDAYMAVCGAPESCVNHAEKVAYAALEMLEDFPIGRDFSVKIDLGFRIGLHSGSVVAGIIGENKYSYDLWGDAVNTASRMESYGEEDKVHVSEEFRQAFLLGADCLGMTQESPPSPHFTERGEIDIKGKGKMKTYFLEKADKM